MAKNARRRNTVIAILILIIIAILLLLSCPGTKQPPPTPKTNPPATPAPATPHPPTSTLAPPAENLTPATITAPEKVPGGTAFSLSWTGPSNSGDYITIVPKDAPTNTLGNYKETKEGASLELTAPITPGPHELRYITDRSRTILGRAPIEVLPITAAIEAPAQTPLGAPFSITWTGPNNKDDYITIVPKDAPDDHYGSYTPTEKGSPLTLTAPPTPGDAELRYVAGQGRKVLTRRPIKIAAANVTLSAPADAIAGSTIQVTWTGPDNAGDYITIVPAETPDGQYKNYTVTTNGSPLNLLMPIMIGNAELRYMTGQGGKVLARRRINILAAEVSLSAPPESKPASDVSITWTGPNNPGDYLTIVPKSTPDGQYAAYTVTSKGSPLTVKTPKDPGEAEIRYMTGQGNNVLARIPIKITP